MRHLLYILPALAVLAAACSGKHYPDAGSSAPAAEQAAWIASEDNPEEAASRIVVWLQSADTADRLFSRQLVSRVLFYYDSIGATDSARRFADAFYARCGELDADSQAALLLAMDDPGKLGALLARPPRNEELVAAVESRLAGNEPALEAFKNQYQKYKKYYDKLK
ncbi:MAG: hypothetical protein HFJ94_08455 [Muribaculaceae bacterium]|jgi:hypothetical protein|nr:hypothetical protein [Muribaculaceae bacterium]